MPLTAEEVRHIAHLARLSLTEEEVALYQEQLSQILDYVRMLQEVPTEDIPPTAQVVAQEPLLAPDVPSPSLPVEQVLANAPEREGDYFVVQAILEEG